MKNFENLIETFNRADFKNLIEKFARLIFFFPRKKKKRIPFFFQKFFFSKQFFFQKNFFFQKKFFSKKNIFHNLFLISLIFFSREENHKRFFFFEYDCLTKDPSQLICKTARIWTVLNISSNFMTMLPSCLTGLVFAP